VRLTALEQELKRLLAGELERDGRPFVPHAVHFACHGGVDLDEPGYTGIVLNDGDSRLTPMMVRGMRLSKAAEPFVFLNACEVGTATTVLSEYGGMAGAFLVEGCQSFLAPLWVVDDVAARNLALDFYPYTLEDGLPVAEAMRRLRASFGTPTAAHTSTPLAYMFCGHPALHLVRAS
jgi:CHAT domain-containing protein